MRGLHVVGCVVLGAALWNGWTAAREPAAGQPPLSPVAVGESVTFTYETTGVDDRPCTIETIAGDFVKCASGSNEREYWRNLRAARAIEKRKRH
jgi:hypothetical protein